MILELMYPLANNNPAVIAVPHQALAISNLKDGDGREIVLSRFVIYAGKHTVTKTIVLDGVNDMVYVRARRDSTSIEVMTHAEYEDKLRAKA